MSLRISLERIAAAEKTIAAHVTRTPSVISDGLSSHLGRRTALKLENLQRCGCFKARGIVNKLASLSDAERSKGLITVSGGNHGIAIASIARTMGIAATVVMPEAAPARSKARVEADGARLILAADAAIAFEIAEENRRAGLTYIHGYDDPVIIEGHGTLGLEFIRDVPELTDVLVSIGGGGLISGVATAMKAVNPNLRIWGVETEGANCMSRALAEGRPVGIKPSSIVTTLGAPTATERTLEHVKALVEHVFVVSDAEAVAGVLALAEWAKIWAEPAAGCLVPAARQVIDRVGTEGVLGLVVCGGNATFDDVQRWSQASIGSVERTMRIPASR
ncbi:pyridoxal-phosphate dependent enzyme [Pendulispora brunnea]|uniref:Pyridoxal-phosphate dependent enzyme n=1 Tax=Pendulispora brunnea TaxID=2905690 RepID=A0ABZ2K4G8_9BACT